MLLRGFSTQLAPLGAGGLGAGRLVVNGCPLEVIDVGYYIPPNCGDTNRVRLGWVGQIDEAPVDAWIVRGPLIHERCAIGRKSQLHWEILEEKSWTNGNPTRTYMVPSSNLIEWEEFLRRLASRRAGLKRLDESLSTEEILAKAHSTDLALAAVDPTTPRELLPLIRDELYGRLSWIERDLGGKVVRGDPWV